ncbi:hypothetical protein CFOL_v3_15821 [Cephalotus follicularis]|uniref:Uncharacterized protein n=1 Tax=Cephalotus follicularis TaxID=3775 RepID=A0A1Q3BX03_CEPFO|nr:hypothetical protein CFOL_v3_15821 [Cephalotus follicularis]
MFGPQVSTASSKGPLTTSISHRSARGRSFFGAPSGSERNRAMNAAGMPALLLNKSSTSCPLATVLSISCSIHVSVNLQSLKMETPSQEIDIYRSCTDEITYS